MINTFRLQGIFSGTCSNRVLFGLGAMLGAMFGLWLLDIDFILGNSRYWQEPYGDSATNLVGLLYFIQDDWRLPLFNVPNLGIPEGANIIFTDSVPLMTLIAKIVYKLTGQAFNTMGLWLFLCFILSGVGMVAVMTRLGQRNVIVVGLAVVLALCAPILLVRIGHAGLMGQFLILFAFTAYLAIVDNQNRRPSNIPMIATAASALLIQAYFFPIVMAFFAAALIQRVIDRSYTFATAAYSFGLGIAICVFVMTIAGFIGFGGVTLQSGGYGLYSMNLLSPLIPPQVHLPESLASYVSWDGSGMTWDANGGQYEGYAYLGLGVIGMLILVLASARDEILPAIRRHMMLTLVLIACFFYAISNKVYLGDLLLLDIPIPSWMSFLTGAVRTGGRMFWPIYYVVVALLTVVILRRFGLRISFFILTGFVLLQVVDTHPHREQLKRTSKGVASRFLDTESWTALIKEHDFVMQFPSHQCGGWAPQWPEANAGLELMLLTAKRNIPINSAYLARHVKDCSAEASASQQVTFEKGGLYIFLDTLNLVVPRMNSEAGKLCRSFNRGIVCTRSWENVLDTPAHSLFTPLKAPAPDYALGETISFKSGGQSHQYKIDGWSVVEPWGTWATDDKARFEVTIDPGIRDDLLLIVNSWAFLSGSHTKLQVQVFAGNTKVETWDYEINNNAFLDRTARIPRTTIDSNGSVVLSFKFDNPRSPLDLKESADARILGIGISSVKLVMAPTL